MVHINSMLDRPEQRECVTLDFNKQVCPAAVTQTVNGGAKFYVVYDQFRYAIGDVIFGDRVVKGDCTFTCREVIEDVTSDNKEVLKIRTIDAGTGVSLLEFIETEPNSNKYVDLERTPLEINFSNKTLPTGFSVFYDVTTSTTTISIEQHLRNQYCIGKIIVGPNVVESTKCIERSISLWKRRDGKQVISVDTTSSNEVVESFYLIEQHAGMDDYTPYDPREGLDDIEIGSIEDELDFSLDSDSV
ncbi:hypothetical protein BgAZ_106490 [Babesia gibsoni]|uniref:Uncharacterized protein n=1 Tax=Babesia gibsoni TaxID=33632 RepID=A0AAD8PFZ9_BABGI|nr:hypothetical protein BgAZ_106490 [Babesia gibsoni]